MRYRLVAAAIFVVTAVGVKTVTAASSPSSEANVTNPAPTVQASSASSSNAPWNIAGTIQQMSGQFWEIQGFSIRVTATTRVDGDVPSVGVYARAVGTVDPDGTWTATQVWVGRAATEPTNTSIPATATPTATATASATPTSLPTPSPTATLAPSPTATSTQAAQPEPNEDVSAPPDDHPDGSDEPDDGDQAKPAPPHVHPIPHPHGHGPHKKPEKHD